MANLGIAKNTIEIIQKYEFAFQKRFGQNFLVDTRVLEKIIQAAGLTKEDMVLEIGPGIGTMTQYLAEHAGRVVAVEIDANLLPILDETLRDYDNVTVINEDILKVDVAALAEKKKDIQKLYPTETNFLYIKTRHSGEIFEALKKDGISIRNMNGYLRISAGSKAENQELIQALDKLLQ